MKILILSDIHANWYALEAILDKESYDALVFLGDAVDFGPSPSKCLKFLMKSSMGHFWGVRGDHDHAMAYGINSKCPGELNTISTVTREWGEEFLSSEEIGFLRRLPLQSEFSINEMNFELVHGSGLDYESAVDLKRLCKCKATSEEPYCNYYSDAIDEKKEINFILTGHSHKPFIKSAGNTTILNPGSAGQPRDLNPKASYAVIDNGNAYIRRVSYDIERTINDLERSALPKKLISKLSSMLYAGGTIN
ncbi:MAG: phosphoesterase [Thermodesulfobacteriota bacterium]|nr:MAG: phosphoesterase [Thermodesulfobacteriota bacterium]